MTQREYILELLDTIVDKEPGLFRRTSGSYTFQDRRIPRVTDIVKTCMDNSGLIKWANRLGLYDHMNYDKYMDAVSSIGTEAHKCIESFISNSYKDVSEDQPLNIMQEARNAYLSYQSWFSNLIANREVSILLHEHPLICKYYGGTCDGVYRIDNKNYVVDYKTSNHVRFDHFLQLVGYAYILDTIEYIPLNGAMIIHLSKSNVSYEEFMINLDNAVEREYFEFCKDSFLSMVYWYYCLTIAEKQYKKLLKWK